jgi:hypothetical protein
MIFVSHMHGTQSNKTSMIEYTYTSATTTQTLIEGLISTGLYKYHQGITQGTL